MQQSHFRITCLACCAFLALSIASAAWSDDLPPAEDLPPAAEDAFSLVVLPDTQAYTSNEQGHAYFTAETQWIVDHLQSQRIVFVTHVGDIVGENVAEAWALAKAAMDRLHGKVPYGFSVGNHDMQESGDSTLFQQTFPASRFERFAWYGGEIKNNANSFQLFSAGGLDFIILHLECNAPDDMLDWANEVLQHHAGRRVIITTHMYLGPIEKPSTREGYLTDPKGRMRWKKCHGEKGNTPEQMWEKCFRKHENLFLVLCGDQGSSQAMRRTVQGVHGNVVHEVLSDYRKGYMRVLRFKPAENKLQIWTYSPYLKRICPGTSIVADPDQHQFSLDYNMIVQ